MNDTLKTLSACFAIALACAAKATPVVTECTMAQNSRTRLVTIKYKLDSYPAVVTLDVKTNSTVSIGGEHICNAQGAVWRKVTDSDADGEGWCTIAWQPDQTWPADVGNGFAIPNATVAVTAWPMDNTPDYMVVDISEGAQQNTQRYYPAVDFLPGSELGQAGAITNNPAYKTSMLVMRKIMAKSVTWTMGSIKEIGRHPNNQSDNREASHQVTLTNNYYIGVFETTQAQWDAIGSKTITWSDNSYSTQDPGKPALKIAVNDVRNATYPASPDSGSFLGKLIERTGIDFDLPSEAQWEFACRAGNGEGKWNDGSAILVGSGQDANLDNLGHYEANIAARRTGPDIVGSYKANDWGLYDMHGNCSEFCLDIFKADITDLNGQVNTDTTDSTTFVRRGGKWLYGVLNYYYGPSECRSACRMSIGAAGTGIYYGFRVVCTAGLD